MSLSVSTSSYPFLSYRIVSYAYARHTFVQGDIFYFDKRALKRLSKRPAAFFRADSVPLPPEWNLRRDEDGAHFYFNSKTKARRWHRPGGYVVCGSCSGGASDTSAGNRRRGCGKDLATLVDTSLSTAFCYECYEGEKQKRQASRVEIHVRAQLCSSCSFRKAVFACYKCASFRCRRCDFGLGNAGCDHAGETKV